jgi:hypothetical protein
MKARGKQVVGRTAGWFYRRKNYDRVYDQAMDPGVPSDYLSSEAWAQRKVLELAGIPVVRQGGVTLDRSKDIASSLPPLQNR